MLEIILAVVVTVCVLVIAMLAIWINQMANALNALGQRVWQLEQRAVVKTDDPVANFKCL